MSIKPDPFWTGVLWALMAAALSAYIFFEKLHVLGNVRMMDIGVWVTIIVAFIAFGAGYIWADKQ